ncbi:unnamed protein product, partial [Echinostoma caproni]|uniref:Peptidyl-prolyl cis-trans isomerase n=1 Tax=Echinostoma caproni TaxID=27848 RepID=A0A183AZU3_9TREM
MSNIYVSEPATNGKVILKTTVGEIEIELWSKETPKACRNFVQLCMEGYYDDTAFHRLVRGFIVQGGDPTGTGEGGESIYGEPFKLHGRPSSVPGARDNPNGQSKYSPYKLIEPFGEGLNDHFHVYHAISPIIPAWTTGFSAALRQEAEQLRREIIKSKRLEAHRLEQKKAEADRLAREAQEKQDAEDAALARLESLESNDGTTDKGSNKPLVSDPDTFSADLAMYRAKTKKVKK